MRISLKTIFNNTKNLEIDVSFERRQIGFQFKKHFYRKKLLKNTTMHFFPSFLSIKNFIPRSRAQFD